MKQSVILIANGDLRLSANQATWEAQWETEQAVIRAIEGFGFSVRRGHDFDPVEGHGFIKSQKHGIEVFKKIPPAAPVVVVEAVWQYSQHLLPGLLSHLGPVLTVANWSGKWPGLVGLLNLNASLTKAGREYSSLWSETFKDDSFLSKLNEWLNGSVIHHEQSHVHGLSSFQLPDEAQQLAKELAGKLRRDKAILGVFDEGCMGMYNAIIPDELLQPLGVYKERLSQSALYHAMTVIDDQEAQDVRDWLDEKGLHFHIGCDSDEELTDSQVLLQCKMYIASIRMAADFGCDAIGIQYQQGLKDLVPASDLVEGLLNNSDRPPVRAEGGGPILYEGRPLPHFNEVDECAGLDALVTNRVWTQLGLDPETTLHDLRYGEAYPQDSKTNFVWTFEISGAVPPQHIAGGYGGATCERQPRAFFPLGGATIKGVCKPGNVVWSRVFIEDNRLKVDLGRADSIELPAEETLRRWNLTTWQWPIMHAVLRGISRDQMMARHKSNHIQVAYAPNEELTNLALATKAAMFSELGLEVGICGTSHGLIQHETAEHLVSQ